MLFVLEANVGFALLSLLLSNRDPSFESVKMITFVVILFCAVQTLLLKTDHSNILPPIHLPFINNHFIILLLVIYVVHTAGYDVLMTMKINTLIIIIIIIIMDAATIT
jgi:hypothetical protein